MAIISEHDQLSELRARLGEIKELQHQEFNDDFLLKFLRARHGDIQRTVELILEYFVMRKNHPDVFISARGVHENFKEPIFNFLSQRTPKGETVVYVRPSKWNPSTQEPRTALASCVPFFEYFCLDEETQRNGYVELMDMRGLSWGHLSYFKPSQIKFGADLTERTLPTRFKKIHILYQSRIVDIMFSLVKPFLGVDIRSALVFHGNDLTSLYEELPRDILPVELGGSCELQPYSKEQITDIDFALTELWARYKPID